MVVAGPEIDAPVVPDAPRAKPGDCVEK